VFSVVLPAGLRITSNNCKNKDTAKSTVFAISTLFEMRKCERYFIFMIGVPAWKMVAEPMV